MIKFNKLFNCLKNPKFFKSYINGVSPLFELEYLLKNTTNIKTLIDVGSNKGQFSLIAKKYYPNIVIHSFEPQIDQLHKQKKILGSNNINYYNVALGNTNKESNIYITARKDSSSLLKPSNNYHKKYSVIDTKKIKLQKLDDLNFMKNIKRPSVLKLDVQGFELETLRGGQQMLSNIDYIIVEVSFVKVYENQVNANDLIAFLNSNFFKIKTKCNLTTLNNKPFQEDVLFVKSDFLKT